MSYTKQGNVNKRFGMLNKGINSVLHCMFIALWGHSNVHEEDGLRKETFLVPACSGAHCSVAPIRRQQFKEKMALM